MAGLDQDKPVSPKGLILYRPMQGIRSTHKLGFN